MSPVAQLAVWACLVAAGLVACIFVVNKIERRREQRETDAAYRQAKALMKHWEGRAGGQ